ncbi:hypothetical protein GPL21_33775 [Bradyrhizobium pachyrhizi]|uniref:Uncharacterized protein n=1 Tax=Bradyrhizobium pachyrhizi TaxID=280333 RepID=A0A844SVN0_9BRAD|nr:MULTISPECIES: hypothetical protein [Bradyrhizobium]MVT70056.1 hypothetical protein [Bradyrhizobium pachyrhizi]WFU54893.1 hypothetical protein QA639_35920 [Bradyrhizobium pachyrhizi]WOH80688.1 hypothetical protein RX327_33880 [Bradyrhizobium sp. BEA-2-5]
MFDLNGALGLTGLLEKSFPLGAGRQVRSPRAGRFLQLNQAVCERRGLLEAIAAFHVCKLVFQTLV